MADEIQIPVSDAPEVQFVLEVTQVDNKLYLYETDIAVFDAVQGQPLPARFPLHRDTPYAVLYENNDGGLGIFAFSVHETLDWRDPSSPHKLRRRLGPRHFKRPAVMAYRFRLMPDPRMRPPPA